jgi:hypothetical protein
MIFWIFSFWWYQFNLSDLETWTFQSYLSSFLFPVVMYLQSVILFPHRFDEIADVGEYFENTRGWFFGLFFLANLFDVADGIFTSGVTYLAGLGASLVVVVGLGIVVSIVGLLVRSSKVHLVTGALFLLVQIWQMFNDHPFLGARLLSG